MTEGNHPIKEFRAGTAVAAIWQNKTPADGRPVPQYSVRIQKRYRDDRSGQWKTTTYFRTDELPKLGLVVSRAYEFLTLREVDDTQGVPSS